MKAAVLLALLIALPSCAPARLVAHCLTSPAACN